jgi:hypothetical protein
MVLYRFLFAPVLLVVAVLAGNGDDGVAPAAPPAVSRQAPVAVPAPPVEAERPSPQDASRRAAPRLRAAR